SVVAQEHNKETTEQKEGEKKDFDADEVIFGHVLDAHEFHFMSYKGSDGAEHQVGIPLPIIIYSTTRGKLSVFSSSKFHHGHEAYDGYRMEGSKIVALDPNENFYDI